MNLRQIQLVGLNQSTKSFTNLGSIFFGQIEVVLEHFYKMTIQPKIIFFEIRYNRFPARGFELADFLGGILSGEI